MKNSFLLLEGPKGDRGLKGDQGPLGKVNV